VKPSECIILSNAIEACLKFELWDAITENALRTLLDRWSAEQSKIVYTITTQHCPLKVTVRVLDKETLLTLVF
jgi:hypothetical protein